MNILRINKELAWEIRHAVMWPEKDLDYVILEDDDAGIHYGLFEEDRVVSVLSLFIEGDQAQFRKFATLESEQGKGFGSQLLRYVLEQSRQMEVKKVWCNARKNKASFYKKFGLMETGESFTKGGKEYIIMEVSI